MLSVQALPSCIALKTKFVPPASSVTTIGCVLLSGFIINKGSDKYSNKQKI
jgi:hypothetical protein